MSGKISTRTKYQLTVEEELFQAADKKIAELNKLGVAQGRTDISEPERQHLPVLVDLGDFENWLRDAESYVVDKRMKAGEEESRGKMIEVEDILGNVTASSEVAKKCHSVMVLAPAGMGKTTLLRRIAQNARREKYKELKNKLVLMLDFRPHLKGRKILPSQVLLGDMFSDWGSDRMKQRYQWIVDNPEKVVFVMDSLDTLPFALDQDERPRPRNCPEYHKAATADVTLCDILAKDWFPESTIISSSREYKVRNLHPSFRPDRCILLDGLTEESVQDLIDGFLGKAKGDEVKNYIKTECPDVWPLLSIPVVLVFSMIGFTEDCFKPKTISGIIIKFFLSLIRSSHVHVKDILTVLKKLMPLAFEGTQSLCFLFTPEFLTRFGLEPEEVTDLGILIHQSQGKRRSTKLMQNDGFFLYFNHQTQQEALAALHVLSLYLVKFKTFMEDEFWKKQFTVVRRFICGTLFNDEVLEAAQELTEISDVDQKKMILLRNLGKDLCEARKISDKRKMLEIFIDLAEAREGVIELMRATISQIDFEDIILSPSDVHSIAYVTKQLEYLESFDLAGCGLDAKKIEILLRTLLTSNVKVRKVNVARNPNIRPSGMLLIGKFARNCEAEKIDLHACNLLMKHLEKFSEGAGDAKLEYLDVRENTRLGSAGMLMLGKLAKHHEVKDLIASRCNPQPNHILKFVEGLENTKLVSLILKENWRKPTFIPELLKLPPYVKKKLSLRGWKICENARQQLNEICPKSLQILLGDEILCRKTSPALDSLGDAIGPRTQTSPSRSDSALLRLTGSVPKFPYASRSALPAIYFPLSHIHSRGDAVSVEIPIFVSCDKPHIPAIILAQKKNDKDWTEIGTTPLNEVESQVVKIQTVEFDFFRIAVLDHITTFLGSANFYVKGELKYDELGNFFLKFRPCGEISHEFDDIPEKKLITFFESEEFRMSDKIEVFLQCDEPHLDFNFGFGNKSIGFKIDPKFLRSGKTLRVLLDPAPSSRLRMKIKYIVKKNGHDLVNAVSRILFQGYDEDKEVLQPPVPPTLNPNICMHAQTCNIQRIDSSIMARTYAASGSNYQHSEHENKTTLARHSGSPSAPHNQKEGSSNTQESNSKSN